MASTWSWLSRRRQREVLQLCLKHFDAIVKVVEYAREAVEAYTSKNLEEAKKAYKKLFDAEREADSIKHAIIEELSKELFHPIDREELIRLVLAADDIADHTKSGIRRLLYLDPGEMPEKVAEALKLVSVKLVEEAKLAREAVESLADDVERSIKLTHEIERIEEEVDDIRSEVEEWIIRKCDEMGASACLTSLRVLESLETATDKVEDLGDVIRSIALLGG